MASYVALLDVVLNDAYGVANIQCLSCKIHVCVATVLKYETLFLYLPPWGGSAYCSTCQASY